MDGKIVRTSGKNLATPLRGMSMYLTDIKQHILALAIYDAIKGPF